MKHTKLFIVFICILILSGCNIPTAENSLPNLSTEEGIRDYLAGEWILINEYGPDIVCKMIIDKKMDIHLSFHDSYSDSSRGDFAGRIKLDRQYAKANEAPDLLSIELIDTDYPGGDFFFKHRTIYNEKRVMSWFFAGNGNCIFDMLSSEDYEFSPAEITFEKVSGETSQLAPRKNDEFYAVYWGKGADKETLWLDDVNWTPPEDYDIEPMYPILMTYYENDVAESILYSIAADQITDILGDDLFPGDVYFVQTDKSGNVIDFVSAEYKAYIEEDAELQVEF